MSGFESLFSFYGLLLGLAVASVASGLGDLWRRRRRRPVGVLLPLLGCYILLAVTQQWMSFWTARNDLTITPASLLVSLGMALPYVFAAQVMFPESDDAAPDGDSHFRTQRHILFGILILPLMLSLGFNIAKTIMAGQAILGEGYPMTLGLSRVVPIVLLAALIPASRPGWHVAGLLLLIANRLAMIFLV